MCAQLSGWIYLGYLCNEVLAKMNFLTSITLQYIHIILFTQSEL
jgi:hypothetical protein